MTKRTKRIVLICIIVTLLLAVFLCCCFKNERLRSALAYFGIGRLEDGDYYMADGHISRLDFPVNDRMLEHAADRFAFVYETYLQNCDAKVYFSIIPDKNCFLAENNGYKSYDYEAFVDSMREKTDYMQYIDIFPLLSLEDYYRTDSHWRQEEILPVAQAVLKAMGREIRQSDYSINSLPQPFKGAYAGEIALPVKAETLYYLTNSVLDGCTVTSYNTGKALPASMYNMEKASGRDPYEMFLSGNDALITIDNPGAQDEHELIIFRDSFGSSIAPLLVESYSKITLVDLRYISSAMLGNFIEFSDQDVLFLYSSTLLNNSMAIK